ncbi:MULTISPECIES: hypothetical protein [Bacillus]|nr:hypothetical protein [Bacillus mobilis]
MKRKFFHPFLLMVATTWPIHAKEDTLRLYNADLFAQALANLLQF